MAYREVSRMEYDEVVRRWQAGESQRAIAQARGLDTYFVTRHGFRDNLVQYLPTGAVREPEAITAVLEHFARERRLPDRGRGILEHCIVSAGFPIGG